ncbi:8-oxo-dGTP diphosphatase [Cyanobacterium sp. HL-69]|uniref:8-oxo-dGTP diphosphatase MutT n=1 Tax=unclassified Cyanobacterium TaxID=2629879 RepID=UPI0008528551|nr:8-oxo-dGTP diphosphatase MutT [Cyanobacterium sp. IPPAS B-1200]AUC61510.1 8-oxo-dGTP diphosphatase [Cyanobacterium sp. HL-69]OEJ78254.1 DNA mismatch repair protein MutT [Cyanobacterium sp. IPPAS B-1200]
MSNLPYLRIGTAVIVDDEGLILIDKRRNKGSMANKWEFPGGKFEEGENAQECIVREIKEELGIDIEVGKHLINVKHDYPHLSLTLMVYYARIISGKPQTIECAEIRWVKPEELDNFDFPDANYQIIEKIKADRGLTVR